MCLIWVPPLLSGQPNCANAVEEMSIMPSTRAPAHANRKRVATNLFDFNALTSTVGCAGYMGSPRKPWLTQYEIGMNKMANRLHNYG